MSSSISLRRSPRIAEQQAKMTSPVTLRRSSRIAGQKQKMISPETLRRSPRIAEMNRLAEVKNRLENCKLSSQPRITRSRVEVKVDNYVCWFDKHTGTWISEKVDYEIDC